MNNYIDKPTSKAGRLLFPVVANNEPSGGRKFIYHVVDFLNEAGFDAHVVHPTKNFRLTWFENSTRVCYSKELFPSYSFGLRSYISKKWNSFISCNSGSQPDLKSERIKIVDSDILVIPETRLSNLSRFPYACQKIIFNQGPYLTFSQHFAPDNLPNVSLLNENVLGMVVVSDLNYQMQRFSFPGLNISQARLFIEEMFEFQEAKKIQIAYMPRRGSTDALAVLNLLRIRGLSPEVSIVEIDRMSQQMVAKTLKESLIFLSFSEREGFGLPAAEAMACGCIVIGYTGNGGEEFFDPEYCYPIVDGDVIEFVSTIEKVLNMYRTESDKLRRKGNLASQVVIERYSRKESKASIVAAFGKLLK